jgi:hypothetical protein
MVPRLQRIMLVKCQWTIFNLFIWNVQISGGDGGSVASCYFNKTLEHFHQKKTTLTHLTYSVLKEKGI